MNKTASLDADLYRLLVEENRELPSVKGNILSAAATTEVKTIYVTSSNNGEGKTMSAISTAYSLAINSHSRVLLVDTNIDAPQINTLFGLPQSPGLTDLLSEKVGIEDTVYPTEAGTLSVMTCGASDLKPLDSFSKKDLATFFETLKENFDYIIFDGSSVLGSSDSSVVAGFFDGILLVVKCEDTTWEVVQQVKIKLENVGGNLLGAVMNKRRYYIPRMLYGL